MHELIKIISKYLLSFGVLLCLINTTKAQGSNDLETLRKRVILELMAPTVDRLAIEELNRTINKDGSWPGIDYEDVSNTGFQHSRHLANIVNLSHAYNKSHTKHYQDKETGKNIEKALDFWFENDFICDNWWWNQIGVPDRMVAILLMMDESLSDKEKENAAPIVGRANLEASGARPGGDLIKIAGILGKYALFTRDEATLEKVIETMEGEIQFAVERGTPDDTRGLQTDLSFHHRSDRVNNTLSYGRGYANAFSEWAAKIGGTKYQFSERAIHLLVDYYLDGICKMMAYATFPDLGAKNRSVSRQGALMPHGIEIPKNLLMATDYRKEELLEIIQIRNGRLKPDLTNSQFFWQSEYYSHQRPDYFTSVRMYSTRNRSMEQPYNDEGLKNHHLGEGSNFVYRTGAEYIDIFPLLDWQKIPGTTSVQSPEMPAEEEIQQEGLTDFVGGLTDGRYGAAVFDFESPYNQLTAKKAWFFFDDEIVCLGAGITAEAEYPVATTLNQTWLLDDVTISRQGDSIQTLVKGEHNLSDVNWIIHDHIGYLFTSPTPMKLRNQKASGSWFSINRQSDSPKREVSGDVFKLWMDHGVQPENASYQYLIVPYTDRLAIQDYQKELAIEILNNTSDIQAVSQKELGITQVIFHQPGKIQVSESLQLVAEHPCMVMLKMDGSSVKSISVADPSRKLERLNIQLNVELNENDAYKISKNEITGFSELAIDLPTGDYAGQSTTITFKN